MYSDNGMERCSVPGCEDFGGCACRQESSAREARAHDGCVRAARVQFGTTHECRYCTAIVTQYCTRARTACPYVNMGRGCVVSANKWASALTASDAMWWDGM